MTEADKASVALQQRTDAHELVANTLHFTQGRLDSNADGLRAPLYDMLSALDVLSALPADANDGGGGGGSYPRLPAVIEQLAGAPPPLSAAARTAATRMLAVQVTVIFSLSWRRPVARDPPVVC